MQCKLVAFISFLSVLQLKGEKLEKRSLYERGCLLILQHCLYVAIPHRPTKS